MHVLPPRIFTAVVVVTIVIIVALDRSRSILPESYSRGRCLGCGREPGGRGQKSKIGGEEGREGTGRGERRREGEVHTLELEMLPRSKI